MAARRSSAAWWSGSSPTASASTRWRCGPNGRAPRFRPGQFLHLALDAYDPSGFWPDSRVFSIASRASADATALRIYLRGARPLHGADGARARRRAARSGSRCPMVTSSSKIARRRAVRRRHRHHGVYRVPGQRPDAGLRTSGVPGLRCPQQLALLLYKEMLDQRAAEVPQFRRCYFVEQPDAKSAQLGAKRAAWLSVRSGPPFRTRPQQRSISPGRH